MLFPLGNPNAVGLDGTISVGGRRGRRCSTMAGPGVGLVEEPDCIFISALDATGEVGTSLRFFGTGANLPRTIPMGASCCSGRERF